MNESAFNQQLRKELTKEYGICLKLSDRFTPGIPDLYVPGGIWIESKVVKCKSNSKIDVSKRLSAMQRLKMDQLTSAGDRCFVAVLFDIGARNKRAIVRPWPEVKTYPITNCEEAHTLPLERLHFWRLRN